MKFLSFFYSPFRRKQRREMREALAFRAPLYPTLEPSDFTDSLQCAIIIMSVPPEMAADLFGLLPPEQVQALTSEIWRLPKISPETRRFILGKVFLEFYGAGGLDEDPAETLKERIRSDKLEFSNCLRAKLARSAPPTPPNCWRVRYSDHHKAAVVDQALNFRTRGMFHINLTVEQRIYLQVASEFVQDETQQCKVEVLREFLGLEKGCPNDSFDIEYKLLQTALRKLAQARPWLLLETLHKRWPNWSSDPRDSSSPRAA